MCQKAQLLSETHSNKHLQVLGTHYMENQQHHCIAMQVKEVKKHRLGWDNQSYIIQVNNLIWIKLSVFVREEFFVWIWQRWHVDHFCGHQSQTDKLSAQINLFVENSTTPLDLLWKATFYDKECCSPALG